MYLPLTREVARRVGGRDFKIVPKGHLNYSFFNIHCLFKFACAAGTSFPSVERKQRPLKRHHSLVVVSLKNLFHKLKGITTS